MEKDLHIAPQVSVILLNSGTEVFDGQSERGQALRGWLGILKAKSGALFEACALYNAGASVSVSLRLWTEGISESLQSECETLLAKGIDPVVFTCLVPKTGSIEASTVVMNDAASLELLPSLGDIAFVFEDLLDGRTRKLVCEVAKLRVPVVFIGRDGGARIFSADQLDEPQLRSLGRGMDVGYLVENHLRALSSDNIAEFLQAQIAPVSVVVGAATAHRIQHGHSNAGPVDVRKFLRGVNRLNFLKSVSGRLDHFFASLFGVEISRSVAPWYGVSSRENEGLGGWVEEPIAVRAWFDQVDQAANITAGLTRDLSWVLHFFAAFAVFAAVAGGLHIWPGQSGPFWIFAELFLLGAILSAVVFARRYTIHDTWLASRFLAEQLRYLRAGMPFFAYQKPALSPPLDKGNDGLRLLSVEQFILRRLFLANVAPSGLRQIIQPELHTSDSLEYFLRILEEQIKFHQRKVYKNQKLGHGLHKLTEIFFVITLAAVLAHFVFHSSYLLIFTAGVPAFAAAFHAIAIQNELRRLEIESGDAARKLTLVRETIRHLRETVWLASTGWVEARNLVIEGLEIMSDVNQQWRKLIQERSVGLPA